MTDDEISKARAAFASECHQRWSQHLNRTPDKPDYKDEWWAQQCGACRFYVTLDGPLGEDWGVCCNAKSIFDRRAMFEHDGCGEFASGDETGLQPFR